MPKSFTASRAKRQPPDAEKAARQAETMCSAAFEQDECFHLFGVPDYGAPEEVTFTRSQEAAAVAWTAAKLVAGEIIFRRAGPPRPPATERLDDDFHS
jgi:hypothetical protein